MPTVTLSVPDDILKQVQAAAAKVTPGKRFRLEFTMDAVTRELHATAVYKKQHYAVGAFAHKTPGGGLAAGAGGVIEFEPAP